MTQENEIYRIGKEHALRRLGRRECSSRDILGHLIKKGIPEALAGEVVSELVSSSLISDARYARMLVREQAGRAKGPAAIRQKLREKGIQLELSEIKSLLSEVTEVSEVDMARALIERKYPNAQKDKVEARRAFQTLLRRGFSYEVIKEVL